MLTEERVAELLIKRLTRTIDKKEQALLDSWVEASPENKIRMEELTDLNTVKQKLSQYTILDARLNEDKEHDTDKSTSIYRPSFFQKAWFRYAAVLLLLGGVAAFWVSQRSLDYRQEKKDANVARSEQKVQPGSNKAILVILGKKMDKQEIDLSQAKVGIKVGADAISYNDGERIATAGQTIQLTTPRGGQYQAVLPDGTRIWLNAASSIRFPQQFSGDFREVAITGEVYFEVSPQTKQPFRVLVNDKVGITVLGTSFNVNAYEDEPVLKTALVSGRVKVRKLGSEEEIILSPNQEYVLSGDGNTEVHQVDVESATAWVYGKFNFKSADIQMVMREISRWYDIDLVYKDEIRSRFTGSMYRTEDIAEVLNIISYTGGVRLDQDKRKIIVSGK